MNVFAFLICIIVVFVLGVFLGTMIQPDKITVEEAKLELSKRKALANYQQIIQNLQRNYENKIKLDKK